MFHFPGNHNYQGSSSILLKDLILDAFVSVNIYFDGEVNVDLKILWKDATPIARDFADLLKSKNTRTVTVLIKSQMIIIGTFRESSRSLVDDIERISLNIFRVTSFKVDRFAILNRGKKYYSISNSNSSSSDSEINYIRIKAYLNNQYCMNDWLGESKERLYCHLNSAFYFRCGRLQLTHQEDNDFRRNLENIYKFSFIEFIKPLEVSRPNIEKGFDLISQEDGEASFSYEKLFFLNEVNDAEILSEIACGFLSVLSGQELSPVFLEYEFNSDGRSIQGITIPLSPNRKLEDKGSISIFSSYDLNLDRDFSFFLESCPLHEKLNRGIASLKMSVSTDIINLQLLSACSAIEYFYSFWLFEMQGFGYLMASASDKEVKRLCSIRDKGQTPRLSEYLKPFVSYLGLDYLEYINHELGQSFLSIRNELLHGRFISDHDIEIFEAKEIAHSLATEVMISIMKMLNPSCRTKFYKNLEAKKPLLGFATVPDGWNTIHDAMHAAYNNRIENIYWNT